MIFDNCIIPFGIRSDDGVWLPDQNAEIYVPAFLPTDTSIQTSSIELMLSCFLYGDVTHQSAAIFCSGFRVASLSVTKFSKHLVALYFPQDHTGCSDYGSAIVERGDCAYALLKFVMANSDSPKKHGLGNETRKLSIRVSAINLIGSVK